MLFVAPVAPHTSAKGSLPPQARTNTAYPADRHGSLYAGDGSVSAHSCMRAPFAYMACRSV